MNSDSQSSPAVQLKSPRKRGLNLIVFFGLSLVAAVVGYSIYVAVHEPDPQETVILGQTKLAAGSPAGVRIVVRNRVSGKPVRGAKVEVALQGKTNGTIHLGSYLTDADGSLGDAINIPEIPPGEYQLIVEVASPLGRDHVARKIEVLNPARILLSSDKPIYQPGQTIHLRSLTLNGRTEKPLANEAVTFEVSDSKGNKVFKETRKSSAFGIASTDFVLATELNLGRYEIRAVTGAATVERTVEIKRYALPKFNVQITTDKSYYLPGETVSGSVAADYFFGKPVGGGTVKLTAATFQEKPVDLNGRTDESGRYSFHFVLPDFFTGMPQKNEQAFLDLSAEVRDTAGHQEEKTLSLSVAQNALEVAVIPEAGAFVPGVENIVYVFTSYPDGRPANCNILANGVAHPGNAQGLCEIKITPADINQALAIQATDPTGKKRTLTYHSDTNHVPPAFLLRSDKAVYEAGQTARISILSPEKSSTVFIDAIKDGQTVLTKSVPLSNDKAEYALNLPSSLVGMLKLNAYIITETGEDRGCSRVIFVNPASSLKIATSLSQTTYRPGQTAKMDFTVTDADGKPTPAALGVVAVDESVFALSENRPGLLKQFLDAENDLLKPRYQIKFFDSPAELLDSENQSLATAYFASLEEQHSGPTLDDLVRDGSVPQRLVDNARSMRGMPSYEKFRSDPQYAAIIRLLEGTQGTYSLREATGMVKVQSVEAHRQQYFKSLRRYLLLGFLTLLFISPILLLIYYSRLGSGINREITANDPSLGRYVKTIGSLHNVLAVLTLLPMICYPAGIFLFGDSSDSAGWFLLGVEIIVALFALSWQYLQLLNSPENNLKPDVLRLRTFLMAFLMQFILSRGAIICIAQERDPDAFIGLWLLMSICAPLAVLGALGSHTRRQLAEKGITAKVGRATFIEILVVLSILFILAAMLLPALAKAKSRALTVQLINDLKQIDLATQIAAGDNTPQTSGSAGPRVRRDFPETLVWRPELITDEHGKASLEIPLADSITTWRASIDGVSAAGKMGSLETPITVFQDFFVDLDLPESMSLGDQVSAPVTCYNYLKEPQDVRFTLTAGNWFKCPLEQLSVHLGPSEVKSVRFPIEVLHVGNHSLQVTAQGTKTADAIEREVRVVPTGERIEHTKNDVLKSVFCDTFTIPQQTIPDSESLSLKCYPSRFSEVVEGMDSIFQEPHGCFEQTSSTTYPNVLTLEYLKRMGRLTPETEVKGQKLINAGYQRLLTFEVPGGGFEWFGQTPAHVGLTAYGILEFTDMNRIHPVDQAMVERTRQWLYSKQNADGSWDWSHGLDEWGANSPVTAYVAWALAESGDESGALDKALNYLRSHPEKLSNNYQKALAANAFLARNKSDVFGRDLIKQLKDVALADDKSTHWTSQGYSLTYSHDSGMEVETTALCTMAMIKAEQWPESVKQALTWLSKRKDIRGTWGSTQGTILAIRALILGSAVSLGQEFESSVTVLLNGEKVETFQINKDNSDVMKQIDLTKHLHAGENRLELRQSPAGELPVQLAGVCWLPAHSSTANTASRQTDLLQIDLQYDRTTLAVNDQLRCAVTVKNNTAKMVNMAIVDLGIPPGFDVDTSAFESLQQEGRLAKFEVTGNQVILYLRELSNTTPLQFNYTLRAKYPLRVQTPPSSVYEYYQPQNRVESKPVVLQTFGN